MPRLPDDPPALLEAAQTGDRAALARLLSLLERGAGPARTVAALAHRSPGDAYTVGITGAPGAGKSTLTDKLIARARAGGVGPGGGPGPVGVLAIDPSSPYSGGAILGDRVRMHHDDDGVYIRSMATRGQLGGLSVAVPDAVRVLAAAGLPVVLVETVGVGQQEVAVAEATDTTVVVVNPGWGDAIQANKAGLMEIADVFIINKADRAGTRETHRDLDLMLDLSGDTGWRPPVVETVASTGDGVDEAWEAIGRHRAHLEAEGLLQPRRRRRLQRELRQLVSARVAQRIAGLEGGAAWERVTDAVAEGVLDPYEAADQLLGEVAAEPVGEG